MPRDYVRNRPGSSAKFTSQKQQKRSGSKGPVWLLAGVFIGLIIAGVFYVKNHPSQLQPACVPVGSTAASVASDSVTSEKTTTTAKAPKEAAQQTAMSAATGNTSSVQDKANANNQKKKPDNQKLQTQFDFYNVLPGKNIVGPSGDEDTSALQPQSAQPNNSSPSSSANSSTTKADSANNDNDSDSDSDDTVKENNSENTIDAQIQNTVKNMPSDKSDKSKPVGYILQAGVFSQYSDADNLKAQLVLLGFEAKISTYTKNGKTLTKVWLGPFHSSEEAKSIQDQLKDNAISAKLLKSQN